MARIIQGSGPRTQGPFLEVNGAAIPESLLEAELFGFESGTFTDAKGAKPGLWEAASGGMLFLDETDALPLVLQSKLLTVIEAKRVRRLGAVVDRFVDVKLIAATQAGCAPALLRDGSAPTCTIAWRWSCSMSRHCAHQERMSSCWRSITCSTFWLPQAEAALERTL